MQNIKKINYTIKSYMPKEMYPLYLKYAYFKQFGKICSLSSPKSYSEKIQWSKLHRTNELLTRLSDKITVREWIKEKVGEEYLVPLVGDIYSRAENISFDNLPNRYVMKANHGCGFVAVINDACQVDKDRLRFEADNWLKHNFAFETLELQYKNIEPKIYFEKNLLTSEMKGLTDYKFFCFNGKVFCLYVMIDTYPDHKKAKLGILDRDFNMLPYRRADFEAIERPLKKPMNYEKMIELAEKLSEGFSHVRVDLYNINGKIYFGEMTFTTGSGFFKYDPEEFDEIIGEKWNLHLGI
ncbi:TupA-like ATPgrasp [Butyrivibrio sp. Su6]|uniref:ATP-grasp fold amidoligase family protein n=1 Tax=Butyrivibrio sp. Su6 TaxID=1520810 RepID=UPI00089E838E|nr:ATP-grasp fold amidoligase family protein [Butyrivibrio sp. Su6]SEF75293.1 TupA-like ATPgrasp [Butyrivibrio sp. Su6]